MLQAYVLLVIYRVPWNTEFSQNCGRTEDIQCICFCEFSFREGVTIYFD